MPPYTVGELTERLNAAPDLDDLKKALQTAMWIEFTTIPPCLTAYWSIKDGGLGSEAAFSLQEIWLEEMLHPGLAANMLKAIGGHPEFNSPGSIPTYPGPLPGKVHPELTIELRGLDDPTLDTFMRIEYPNADPVALTPNEIAAAAVLGGPLGLGVPALSTIGAFYAAVAKAFTDLSPPLDPAGQVVEPAVGVTAITSPAELLAAVELIARQGEGSATSPADTAWTTPPTTTGSPYCGPGGSWSRTPRPGCSVTPGRRSGCPRPGRSARSRPGATPSRRSTPRSGRRRASSTGSSGRWSNSSRRPGTPGTRPRPGAGRRRWNWPSTPCGG
ncbi:MAG: hypothetical protein K2X87_00270 [Gemmataceae bacterium]|nr:hypothetical protein [Gemmataceae bacterium]